MTTLTPALRAFGQLDEPVFLGVVLRSVALAAGCFALLALASFWGVRLLLADQGWWSWIGAALGGVGASLLALLLFLPVSGMIATLFTDRIADAVEHRHYPGLPPATPAKLSAQIWDGVALGLRVFVMQVLALVLALLLPGVGFALGWLVASWAIGRGVFVAVAMRRMDRRAANALYRDRRTDVLLQGGLMTAGNLVPLLNLLVPVLGVAAMVHVLHLPRRGL